MLGALGALAQQPAPSIPTVDGGEGPCHVQFKATDGAGNPVGNARISVQAEWGLFGSHKLDLTVLTDKNGMARFIGLPDKTDGILYFQANKGNLQGVATVFVDNECKSEHALYMGTPAPIPASAEQ